MSEDVRQLCERLRKKWRLSSAEMKPIWSKLEEVGEVDEVLSEQAIFDDLVDAARATPEYRELVTKRELERRLLAGRPPQKLKEYLEVEIGEFEKERATALSEALALQAADWHAVANFRNDIMDGKRLSPEQARAFLTSPAVRSFPSRCFEEWEIPPVNHDAKMVCTHRDIEDFKPWAGGIFRTRFRPWIDRYYSVFVDPPGITKSVLYGSHRIKVPEGVHVDEHYFYRENDRADEYMREVPESLVRYPWGDRIHEITALPGSLLDRVLGLGKALVAVYGWRQEDAVWFVLTGEAPQISPLEVGTSLLTGSQQSPPVWTITLEVAPWVKVETVTQAYREIQSQIKRGGPSKGEIKHERKLALFRFLVEQTKAHGERPKVQLLFERWNEMYQEDHEWHYKKANFPKRPWDSFRRALDDAEETMMHPHHYFPQRKVKTRLEEWQEDDLRRRRIKAESELERILAFLRGDERED